MRISDWSSDVCSSDLAQIGAGAPLKKRLWQAIVRRKVENQAVVLDRAQIEGGRTLREMTAHVRSGDPGNVEARAARFYWPRRSAERRVGNECVSTCTSRLSPNPKQNKHI